jgi:formylglycine-generating enzyme required for sulfatase activity
MNLQALLIAAFCSTGQSGQAVVMQPFRQEIPGGKVSFEMLPIPAGTFLMGSPETEKGRSHQEGPIHPVRLSPFWMGKCEVTWNEVDEFLISTDQPPARAVESSRQKMDGITRPTPPYIDETFGHGRDRMPVLGVTQHFAMEYCRWLSRKTGRLYRLPTEAEWEFACRAGTTTPFSFGNGNGPLSEYAWYAGNSGDSPHAVGSKKPNPWGLFDMHGNVSEWCLDSFVPNGYTQFQRKRPADNPFFPPGRDRYSHVVRGGAWTDPENQLRCAARTGSSAKWNQRDPGKPGSIWWLSDGEFVGFRVVAPVDATENPEMTRSLRHQKTP